MVWSSAGISERTVQMVEILEFGILVGYALVLLAVGGHYARRQSTAESFYLADRSLGSFSVFGTTFSTFLGTGLVFTLGAFGYHHGVGGFVLVGVAVFGLVLFALAAPRLKRASDREAAVTLPALMGRYWGDRTVVLAALVTVSLFTGTLSASFLVVGSLLEGLLGVPAPVATVGFGVLIVGYTVIGGFRAVVVTDLIQMGCIVVGLVLVLPLLVLSTIGTPGSPTFSAHAGSLMPPLNLLVVYLLVGVFAFFGSQDLHQRVFAAESPREARRGMLLFAGSLAIAGSVAVALGIAATSLAPGTEGDRALVALTESVARNGALGLVLLGFLGLANSDADSQMLTVASNVTEDLLPGFGGDSGDVGGVEAARVAVAGVGVAAIVVTVSAPNLVAVLGALGSWFAVLGLVVAATLFWDRTTEQAAFAGLAVGYILPIAFVSVTGEFGAAPVVGVVPAAAVLLGVSFLTGSGADSRFSHALDRWPL